VDGITAVIAIKAVHTPAERKTPLNEPILAIATRYFCNLSIIEKSEPIYNTSDSLPTMHLILLSTIFLQYLHNFKMTISRSNIQCCLSILIIIT